MGLRSSQESQSFARSKNVTFEMGAPSLPSSLIGLPATLLPFQVPPKVHCTRACNAVLLRERRISCSLFYVPGPFSFTVTGCKKMKTCQIAKSNNATSPAKNILFILKLLYLQYRRLNPVLVELVKEQVLILPFAPSSSYTSLRLFLPNIA